MRYDTFALVLVISTKTPRRVRGCSSFMGTRRQARQNPVSSSQLTEAVTGSGRSGATTVGSVTNHWIARGTLLSILPLNSFASTRAGPCLSNTGSFDDACSLPQCDDLARPPLAGSFVGCPCQL